MDFTQNRHKKIDKLAKISQLMDNKWLKDANNTALLLQSLISSHDTVCLEGNNQKQAVFLAKSLCQLDPKLVNNLHIVQSCVSLPEHVEVFERGIANRIDFCYAGGVGAKIMDLVTQKKVEIGGIHTYLELYARYFLDLTPKVALLVAEKADRNGNIYTGANTEDTPTIAEAVAFKDGIVIVEVSEIVDTLPRVDIPVTWIDVLVHSPTPAFVEPLFTRDPAKIDEIKILMAMMTIKGIYAKYEVNRLNHGVGYATAAIELLLPTYAKSLGLKGKICQYMVVNPCPTLIPAIEDGFVKTICSPGGEVGMNQYVAAHSDIFFNGLDGSGRSNRAFAQLAGLYAIDMFIGASLQIDIMGNSSTATKERLTGFGGAPNLGSDASGRRHASATWLKVGQEYAKAQGNPCLKGRKLVVQIVETFQAAGKPTFVESLDAVALQQSLNLQLPPIMIFGDDVTHIVTEVGIANLLLCKSLLEREHAIRAIAGYTPVGLKKDHKLIEQLHQRGVVVYPEDLGIKFSDATREVLAAKSIKDLVEMSHGLYNPPVKFRDW